MDDQNQQGQKERIESAPRKFLRAIWAGFKSLCLWIWESVPTRRAASRGVKYAVLLLALAVNAKVVFDGFSYYLARRSLDAELEKKNVSSLEHLGVLTRRERALVIDTLETRCTERNQLAVFRVFDAETHAKLRAAHLKSLELRSGIIAQIDSIEREHRDWGQVVDLVDLRREIRKATFAIALLPTVIKPAGQVQASDPRYDEVSRAIIEQIETAIKSDAAALVAYGDTLRAVQAKLGADSPFFKDVDVLERRLARLKEIRKQTKSNLDDLGDILSRYAVWTQALTGDRGENPLLDEMAFQLSDDEQQGIWKLDCARFERYFLKVNGVPLRRPPSSDVPTTTGIRSALGGVWDDLWNFYREQLLGFFNSPPVGQTLFVTLCLGALGALTINALRLSKIGWWQPQPDPLWGELLLSPLLGALGAFGIFLLGSAGLLLSGDAKANAGGATTLSPFFIGVLGFISGLLYDEAFGRVRRFGAQLFSGDAPVVLNTPEDQSLAQELREAGASSAADLVLKFGIGKRIAEEPEFTLLMPSDEAMGQMTFAAWKNISEARTRPKFENWLRRHHALKRVIKADVAAAPGDIAVESGKKYPAVVESDVLKIGGIGVVAADISWKNGVIHVLDGDVPEA